MYTGINELNPFVSDKSQAILHTDIKDIYTEHINNNYKWNDMLSSPPLSTSSVCLVVILFVRPCEFIVCNSRTDPLSLVIVFTLPMNMSPR